MTTTATTPDLLESAASFVAAGDLSDGPSRAHARLLLADAMTLALAAGAVPGASALFELGVGSGKHRAWFSGSRLGAADGAFANAAAICARFQEDTEMNSWAHPGGFVVPAAVAASVEGERSWSDLVEGLVSGYATTVWLAGGGDVALGLMTTGRRPSPTFGPAGACAAAARALGLDTAQARHALSGALLVGRGSLHSVGAGGEDWRLHNPTAARDGLTYALAARAGMTSGPGALDARHGFVPMFAGLDDLPASFDRPPRADMVRGVWMKALPTLGDNMAVALAARELHRRGVRTDGDVRVRMNEHFANFPGTQNRPPYVSITSALSSVRFATAQLLLHGTLDFGSYARRDDPAVCALADAIEVEADANLDYLDAEVTVSGPDGDQAVRAADLPRTLYFRDEEEQLQVSREIHGPAGPRLVERLLGAQDDEPAARVIEEALDAFHG